MGKCQTLDTIWEVSDHLWEQIRAAILEMDPPKNTGRKRVDPRQMLDGKSGPVYSSKCGG